VLHPSHCFGFVDFFPKRDHQQKSLNNLQGREGKIERRKEGGRERGRKRKIFRSNMQ
jgi:hypothetical protein